jgi:DNA-binding transcriptional ArsR family regulator
MVATRTKKIDSTANSFRLLADSGRCKILTMLSKDSAGMCVYEIADALGTSHSAASHSLAKLEANNIINGFRDGQKMCYRISKTKQAQRLLKALKIFQ